MGAQVNRWTPAARTGNQVAVQSSHCTAYFGTRLINRSNQGALNSLAPLGFNKSMARNHIYTQSFHRGDNIATGLCAGINYCNHFTTSLMPIESSLIGIVIGGEEH